MKYVMLLSVAAMGMLVGCAQVEEELKFPAPKVELTMQQGGQKVLLRTGDYAKISLKENASTGYSWFFRLDSGRPGPQLKKGQAVELAGERTLTPGNAIPGAPGVREVMIKAMRPGTVYVIGDCLRPWDKDKEPAQSVRYHFEVTR